MQLPFAVIPLVQFVSDRGKMGSFAIPRGVSVLAWVVAAADPGAELEAALRDLHRLLLRPVAGW